MIVRIGVQSGIDSFRDLTDAQVDGGLRTDLEQLLGRERGVQSFHRLRLRRTGPNVIADVHIVVDPLLSVSAAHQIAERVRLNVMKERPEVREILVHVDVHNDAEIEEAEHHSTVRHHATAFLPSSVCHWLMV
jgi:divalent metal cation (Fe/Co/Zn/Cd) transporter